MTNATAPEGYRALDADGLARYLSSQPGLVARLGDGPDAWTIQEVGDGNLNLVFIVTGPKGSVVAKQALPYVRMVGEGWPLPAHRNQFEHMALQRQYQQVPHLVPEPLHHEPALCLTVMAHLDRHIILREGLVAGKTFPTLAEHMGRFLADTLVATSDLAQHPFDKKADVARFCANTHLCQITENLVFTDPYYAAELNKWTSPQLDAAAAALKRDHALVTAAQDLKYRFLTHGEALIHGDLHTGSVMVADSPDAAEADTRVIDSEFAFYGPMGFDVGAFLGNLLLAYFAQPGHERRAGERDGVRAWLLAQLETTWQSFAERFRHHWTNREGSGAAYPTQVLGQPGNGPADAAAREAFLAGIWQDSLGFAGMKMIRRLVGLAHVADFERIADPDRRAACEKRALVMGRQLAVARQRLPDMAALLSLAQAIADDPPPAW